MKLIIAGDRNFSDYPLLLEWASWVDNALSDPATGAMGLAEVVSGGARGADTLGEVWAEEAGVPIKRFPANWDDHGKAAGYIRNKEMADYADMLLAFIAPGSKGTLNMVETMRKVGKPALVVPAEIK